MKVGLFGGTFDPIHNGHLAAARAACRRFSLERVYFIPAGNPPHRKVHAAFEDRYAMVALACAGESRFIPSLADAPSPGRHNYTIDMLRKLRRCLGSSAELHFLIGADAFLEVHTWRQWRAVLNATNFIVISRPGFDLALVESVLPPSASARPRETKAGVEYRLQNTSVFILSGVWEPASGTHIRAALGSRKHSKDRSGGKQKDTGNLLPRAVAEYLEKTRLYNDTSPRTGRKKHDLTTASAAETSLQAGDCRQRGLREA